MKVLFSGGVVFLGERFVLGDVLIEDDHVIAIGQGADSSVADRVVDCTGSVVSTSFVDAHVHLRTPGVGEVDDPLSIVHAALAGGFGTVVAMANTVPPIDRVSRFRDAMAMMGELPIEVIQAACVTMGREGDQLVDVGALVEAGVEVLSDDGSGIQRPDVMRAALEASAQYGIVLAQHAEDEFLAAGGVVNDGPVAAKLGVIGIPEVAESVMIARDIELLKVIPGRLHLQHVSARESLNLFRQAKREGLRISAEVTPHHLLLNDISVADGDPRFKVNPPLRSAATRMALVQGVLDGTFDAIATDHAPHPASRKDGPIERAAFGMLGLAEAFSVAWSALIATFGGVLGEGDPGDSGLAERVLAGDDGGDRFGAPSWRALGRLLTALTVGPGEILGRSQRLKPGGPADIVVLSPVLPPFEVPSRWYRSPNSPYQGLELTGRIEKLFLGGVEVVSDGEVASA